MSIPKLDRRQFLIAGGGALAAAAIPGAAGADVPDSAMFKLDGTGGNPIWKKSLHANWLLQSFAYDNLRQQMYFLQTKPETKNGDLWVTKTDTSGNELGAMALHGFGHGVSLAVEPYNGEVFLWSEWQVRDSGFGGRIGRFRFVNGATLDQSSTAIQDMTPRIMGTDANPQPVSLPQPVIDPQFDRYVVRYKLDDGSARIVVFRLSDARAGRLTRPYRLTERALPPVRTSFQGFTAYGRYAYLLEGRANGPSEISIIDLNDVGTEPVRDPFPTNAGQSLPNREPEGMAIWLAPGGNGPIFPRLTFGFASNTDGVRQSSVFYKDEFES